MSYMASVSLLLGRNSGPEEEVNKQDKLRTKSSSDTDYIRPANVTKYISDQARSAMDTGHCLIPTFPTFVYYVMSVRWRGRWSQGLLSQSSQARHYTNHYHISHQPPLQSLGFSQRETIYSSPILWVDKYFVPFEWSSLENAKYNLEITGDTEKYHSLLVKRFKSQMFICKFNATIKS